MQVKASDIVGRYRIKLEEVRNVVTELLEQGASVDALAPASSDASALQANFNLLLLKYHAPIATFLGTGTDSTVLLDDLETTLVETIDCVYQDVAAALQKCG